MENEILLVGLGNNKYKLNDIEEFTSLSDIGACYTEDSCFYKAASEAFNSGIKSLYILNLDDWEDIKNIKDILEDLSFDYVVPLDLYIDDTYYDTEYGKNLTYSQTILLTLYNTMSTVIMTGKHASEFETLDVYLDDENNRFEKAYFRFENLRQEGFIYVANMLNQVKYANVILASSLSQMEYGEYPTPKISITQYPIFDIYYSDINNKLVYFKNNESGITIENLVNFSNSYILRLIPVYKILKYFYYHKPDMDKFIGKAFTEYRKLKIKETLINYLNNLVDILIYHYEIISITTMSNEYGSVDVVLRYNIWPKFTTEKYLIETSL